MKHIAAIVLSLLAFSAVAASSGSWLDPVPASLGSWQQWEELPNDSFFEIPASKLPTAEAWLSDTPYLAQGQSGVSYFGRPKFDCPAPKKTYLIRASYINGGTGEFQLFRAGSAIVVSHGALGPYTPPSKTALVACLSKEPTAVFSSMSTAL